MSMWDLDLGGKPLGSGEKRVGLGEERLGRFLQGFL